MAQKIKNLPKTFRLNKKSSIPTSTFPKQRLYFGIFLFLLALGLALPLHATAAAIDWKEALIAIFSPPAAILYHFSGEQLFFSTLGNLALALATTVLQIFLVVTNAFLSMAIGILAIVTHPNFIVLSYTNPAGNPLLQIGWTLTRDLANIGFIIILVIIGLATALRIREYQWQKTLPLLIGIALLINFTPVILGLVVDASNIIMNFFLGGMVNLNFVESIWSEQWAIFLNSWQVVGFEIDATSLAKAFSLIVFGGISGLIFLVYSLLFVLRYIVIWMLVILSPIAFFCYILPATRRVFSLWWNQFIQWCIVGAAAAFFLYLSSYLIGLSYEGKIMGPDLPNLIEGAEMSVPAVGTINLVNTLLPYGIAIGFLIVGFFVALSTSAMGATAVIAVAQKGVKTAGKWTGKKAGRGIEKGLKIPEKAEWLGRRAASKPFLRETVGRPLLGYAKRRKEEQKKETEGMPFRTQAAIKRKKGESIQDSLRRVVRGYDPRKFATQAHADDIDLDVIKAMSVKQATATRDRGSDELKEALQNGIKKNGVALQQEYLNLQATAKTLRVAGKTQEAARKTEEAHRLAQKTRIIQDPDFIA